MPAFLLLAAALSAGQKQCGTVLAPPRQVLALEKLIGSASNPPDESVLKLVAQSRS